MRLINIHTRQLEEFFGERIPSYYILSHTWENAEVSYQDYTWLLNYETEVEDGIIDELPPKQRARVQARAEGLRNQSGYKKIQSFIRVVLSPPRIEFDEQKLRRSDTIDFNHPASNYRARNSSRRFDVFTHHVWIDTCCINKESSAELSEAINSMYMWYRNAELCITFLCDVDVTREGFTSEELGDSSFPRSRWWTRGWTLQELLAPRAMLFFNKDWEFIIDRHLALDEIEEQTGIPPTQFSLGTNERPIAERMSWAANREATRVEDRAYCLMGIFGVNMPLIYGEGEKAFQRLQHEIANTSGDQSIFAWGYNKPIDYYVGSGRAIFAYSPKCFSTAGKVELLHDRVAIPFSVTNVGLQLLGTLVRPVPGKAGWGSTFLVLNAVGVRMISQTDIIAIPVPGSGMAMELGSIAEGVVIYRAIE